MAKIASTAIVLNISKLVKNDGPDTIQFESQRLVEIASLIEEALNMDSTDNLVVELVTE